MPDICVLNGSAVCRKYIEYNIPVFVYGSFASRYEIVNKNMSKV